MTEQPAAAPAGRQPPVPQDAAAERVEKLRAQLLEAEAALPQPDGLVRLRVAKPHDSFSNAGVTVGALPTPVPAHAVARLMGAAAGAGVKIEEA